MPTTLPHRPRSNLAFLAIWCLLQLPRLIAIPLIADVAAGTENEAWMYPAVLDVVVAVASIPVAWLLWRRRGLLPFIAGVLFFVVSMVDHGGAVTAGLMTTTPQVFGGSNAPASAAVVPAIQWVGDIVAVWLLVRRPTREWFLGPSAPDVVTAGEFEAEA